MVIRIPLRKNRKIFHKAKKPLSLVNKISFIAIMLLLSAVLNAQEKKFKNDSLTVTPVQSILDSLRTQSLKPKTDSTTTRPVGTDTLKVVKNGIETTILYYAEDSIITKTATNITYLYGNAYIEYGKIKLDAAEIIIDRNNSELIATGVQDSTGKWIGLPVFQDGGGTYETRGIRYNFETNKAKITGVVTQQDQGYLSGDAIKKNPDGSAYISGGKFIPCDNVLATTFIKANKIKVIPGDKVITGPFLLYIGGIPTIFGLPFGFFPETSSEAESGILFPKYGEERIRGIFLRDGGYFFGKNEFIRTALTGSYYSKGSYGLSARSTYKKRYSFSGSLDLSYNNNQTPEFEENSLNSQDFWVSWQHRPESRGNTRFSASVNAGTSTFNANNFSTQNFQNNVRSEFRSNISLSGAIPGTPFTYSMGARHNQNVQTGVLDVSLPELSVNMSRVKPFAGAKGEALKRVNFSWTFLTANSITNVIRPNTASFDIVNQSTVGDTLAVTFANIGDLIGNAQNGARHSIPLSTSFPFLKSWTVSPSLQFEELWYLEKLDYTYIEDQNAVRIDTIPGFSRSNTYGANVSLSTQIYGNFSFKETSRIEAIRHIMIPSVSFSYRPDFGQEKFGYYKNIQVDTTSTGAPVTRFLSIYDGFAFGSPSLGESASIGFSLNNKVEMKVRSDTAKSEKVAILENLSLSTSYNFLADSFNLSDVNLSMRTTLFKKKISVNAGLILDPYSYVSSSDGETNSLRRVDALAVSRGVGLGTLRNARFTLSTNLNSKAANNGVIKTGPNQFRTEEGLNENDGFNQNPTQEYGSINEGGNTNQQRTRQPQFFDDPNAYMDFNVPWNIRLSYDYNFRQNLVNNEFQQVTRQSIRMSGNLELTQKWQLTFNTGYDFDLKEFVQTSLGVYRDLGCWELSGNWVPFGRFTSYTVDIQIKASALRDLKLSRRRSFFDN
ncbi:MAG: hypothetical protein ACJAXX_001904 [Roseivirga sp.]|jgi:hypothetical protein